LLNQKKKDTEHGADGLLVFSLPLIGGIVRECSSDSGISASWWKAQATITVNTLSFIIKTNPSWGLIGIWEQKS
jgi:hypothetical protein